jgi:2-C-methyl-D-erythritol 2,4-cyclodiphosphate synthase
VARVTEDAPRVGLGFDVHPRAVGRPLWLGGVRFDGEDGLGGHSDGDAVCHAIADALLGAAGLGDLGEHFPETDPAMEGIAGADLLGRTAALVREAGRELSSCDATVICERPSVAPRRAEIRATLAAVLGVPVERLSVKATRPEGLGLSGDGAGCLAVAVLT